MQGERQGACQARIRALWGVSVRPEARELRRSQRRVGGLGHAPLAVFLLRFALLPSRRFFPIVDATPGFPDKEGRGVHVLHQQTPDLPAWAGTWRIKLP
jgi:hypothetical protein